MLVTRGLALGVLAIPNLAPAANQHQALRLQGGLPVGGQALLVRP